MLGRSQKRSRTRPPRVKRPKTRKGKPISLAARLRNYFFAGVLVTAPVAITFWLSWRVISFVDNRVTPLIPPKWNPETYLPFGVPGLGLIVVFIILTLIGFLAAGYAGRLVMRTSEAVLARVPVISSVHSWTKQVFETVLSRKSSAFREVVMVEYPHRGCWAVGFITGRTEGEVQELTSETVVNVFVPATPNPTTGFLLFIPEHDVHHLDLTVEEGIKLVISGGIVVPPPRVDPADDWRNKTVTAADQAHARAVAAAKANGEEPPVSEEEATAKRHKPGLLARLRIYFFAGILVTAPISITVWLAWEFITFVDERVARFIPPFWNPESYLQFSLPGFGLLLVFVVLTLVGFFTAGLIGRSLVRLGERFLDNLPVIRGIYAAVKQITQTVFKKQSTAFREVVLMEYPRPDSWAIGFITGRVDERIREKAGKGSFNIFLPTTPNPTSGFLLFVPREKTRKLTMTVEEGIKMVVSGGIVTPTTGRSARQTQKDRKDPVLAEKITDSM
jgi:uncharacterized membrane protein